jgi:hypothetical protein
MGTIDIDYLYYNHKFIVDNNNSKNDKQSVISNFICFLNAPLKYPQA